MWVERFLTTIYGPNFLATQIWILQNSIGFECKCAIIMT